MLPYEQLIFGFASGLTASLLLRWTPLWRDLIAATAATSLIHIATRHEMPRVQEVPFLLAELPKEIITYPYFALGATMAIACVLAVLYLARSR